MSVGASIKKGFGTAGKSMDLIGVVFVFGAIFSLINVFLSPAAPADPNAPTPPPTPGLVVSVIVFIFLSIFLQGGMYGYLRERLKSGVATLGTFVDSGKKYYLRLFLLGLLVTSVVLLFVVLAAVAIALLQGGLLAVAVALGTLLIALAVYYLYLLFLAPYVVTVNDTGVLNAVKTSINKVSDGNLMSGFFLFIFLGLAFIIFPVFLGMFIGQLLGASPDISALIAFALVVLTNLVLFVVNETNPSFRASKFGKHTLVQLYVLAVGLVFVGFCIGLLLGAILAFIGFLMKTETPNELVFALLSSLVNAYLSVAVTAAFMNFYLGLPERNNNI